MSEEEQDTYIQHLEALRLVLIRCLLALAICLLPLFFVAPYAMNLMIRLIVGESITTLNYFAPLEVFILQIKTALVLDIILCFPYLTRQVWSFVAPALYENERRFVRSLAFVSGILFTMGVFFCLFLILPLVIRFGLSFMTEDLKPLFGIGNILSLSLWLSVVFGIMFQFPLVTYALIRAEIVPYDVVRAKRAYVFVGILFLSALLTPPDIVSQLMLTFPTYGLFELGLFFGKKQVKKS